MQTSTNINDKLNATANLLRAVYQRTAALPGASRKKAVQVCLAYQLRGCDQQMLESFVDELYATFGGIPKQATYKPVADVAIDNEQSQHLKAFFAKWINIISGQNADIEQSLDSLVEQADFILDTFNDELHDAAKKQKFLGISMMQLLARVKQRSDDNENALNQAANESFNRLLTSLNPESAASYLDENKFKIGPFHKAAMYDALVEKYQQLKAYHEKGRLVRDFRGMYRTHLAQLAKEKSTDEA